MHNILYNTARSCRACNVVTECKGAVPGDGPLPSRIILIGTMPARNDKDFPYQNRAGDILERLLRRAGLKREECLVTTLIKCRPESRTPTPEEMKYCGQLHLGAEVSMPGSEVLVTMGEISTAYIMYLFNEVFENLDREHGIPKVTGGRTIFPTYDPADCTSTVGDQGIYAAKTIRLMEADFPTLGHVLKQESPQLNLFNIDATYINYH